MLSCSTAIYCLTYAFLLYILYRHYQGREPRKAVYIPLVYLSIFWAVSIHLVTAFLLAGLPARPFWHSGLLGPRFLASAFAAGSAFMVLTLAVIRWVTPYRISAVGHRQAGDDRDGGRAGQPDYARFQNLY